MPTYPFTLIHRRSDVSGYRPSELKSGELFIQQADNTIIFKNDLDEFVCISNNNITTGQTGDFSNKNHTHTIFENNLSITSGYFSVGTIQEDIQICNKPASGLINFDLAESASMYYLLDSTSDFYLNLKHKVCKVNDILDANKTITVTFLNPNSSTPYSLTGISIDETGRSIKWLNNVGSHPIGNANSIDIYSITAVKTGDNLYTIFGTQAKFS